MTLDDIIGIFGSSKRDKEAAIQFYGFLTEKFNCLENKQDLLMKRIADVSQKLDEMEAMLSELHKYVISSASPKSEIAIDEFAIDEYATPGQRHGESYAAHNDRPNASKSVPAPFYANLDDKYFIPASDSMKENVYFRVVPDSPDSATVEFNTLCIPGCLQMGVSTLEGYFDFVNSIKDPNGIEAENATTAHFENGEWVIDGKIRLRLV